MVPRGSLGLLSPPRSVNNPQRLRASSLRTAPARTPHLSATLGPPREADPPWSSAAKCDGRERAARRRLLPREPAPGTRSWSRAAWKVLARAGPQRASQGSAAGWSWGAGGQGEPCTSCASSAALPAPWHSPRGAGTGTHVHKGTSRSPWVWKAEAGGRAPNLPTRLHEHRHCRGEVGGSQGRAQELGDAAFAQEDPAPRTALPIPVPVLSRQPSATAARGTLPSSL